MGRRYGEVEGEREEITAGREVEITRGRMDECASCGIKLGLEILLSAHRPTAAARPYI